MANEFFINNRNKYFNRIQDNSVTILFSGRVLQSTADQQFPFEVNRNFYYLTGINQPQVILVLLKNGDFQQAHLFLEENDPILMKWVGKKLEKDEASRISGIDERNIHYINNFDNFIYSCFNILRSNLGKYDKLYLDLEKSNLDGYSNQALEYSRVFKKHNPEINIYNCYPEIVYLRMFKEPEEIELIKESIKTTKEGIEALMNNSKAGMYEYQLEAYFDFHLTQDGQKGVSFETIAASGKNATILHYVNNNDVLNEDELILFDLGCKTNLYISDISRTFPVSGKFTKRQKEVYEVVLNANKKSIEFLKPGVTWKEFNDYAKQLLTEGAKSIGLIKEDHEISKYYFHSIGHSIGLDTHDPCLYDLEITEGMVLTVEPGLYIEEEGIGIRIEDNILITKNGSVNLSSDIIKEVKDIEEFMNKR